MIEVNGISKSFLVAKRPSGLWHAVKSVFHREYTTVEAIKDISFTIPAGEIVGYIGPNGAGKSTTIKIMSGILVPDHGTCSIMGYTPWEDRTLYVKNIGVVFGQRTQLWWDVPVMDSYELLRDIYKIPEHSYKATLELLIETLDLSEIIHTPVRQLSLGQRMRCEIGASLLHSPDILFLDEPTIGLDAVSKIAVRQFIQRINKERGITIILTTHDMNDIEALAERILLIGKGTLLYDGNIQGLRGKFGTRRTITAEYQDYDQPLHLPEVSILSTTANRAILSVDTELTNVSDVISQLANQVQLMDVTIQAQPIEDIIVQMYKEYQL
ncbi:ABC transporter ATP-binding protein [Paenibacillus aquistagni]|uniref:ABC-2 type transport system ATP-binding protein n=1 Tax=Paenibacillus aquistagni TaxID=1852522 RepID=A0A1X7IWV7_9BACL|nr:ATP-binding cassette domain-containing protein [Paenibacillus aquistagni]SMG19384.1 ABC-2 type transport system ATP-binding protein [Paenibacillus aquistagni]